MTDIPDLPDFSNLPISNNDSKKTLNLKKAIKSAPIVSSKIDIDIPSKNKPKLNFDTEDFDFQTKEEIKTQKSSKEVLMDYVKNTNDGDIYTFKVNGDPSTAHSFIQAMRSHLSRFRAKAREMGKTPKTFYTKIVSIECVNHVCTVKLKRTVYHEKELNDNLENFLNDLSI